MIIKSLSGHILYQSTLKTMRLALEECAERGIDLEGADLRRMKLSSCNLDGIKAQGASFWGSDLEGTDLGVADLYNADFRYTNLKDVCMAQSDLRGCDMRGAYFSRTIIEGANLENIQVSCPSFWDCDLSGATGLTGAVLYHLGETPVPLAEIPLIVRGLEKTLVFEGPYCFWGNMLYRGGDMPPALERSLYTLKSKIDKILKSTHSRSANPPIPKIVGGSNEN